MTRMENVAFVGRMGSGKSYYSQRLRDELLKMQVKADLVSASSKIREVAEDLFGMKGKDRDLMQRIAGAMREIDPGVWTKYLISDIKRNSRLPFIMDDLRFESEATMIRESFSLILVKLRVDDRLRIAGYVSKYGRAPSEKELNDVTETSSDSISPDITLDNDYTEPTAARNISIIIEKLSI